MKKEIYIPITTTETRENRYIEAAEKAIQDLRRLVLEMELGTPGTTIIANEEIRKTDKNTIRFSVCKTIDMDVIKEQLENVEKLVKQLHGEVDKLETAIITELIKEKP